ncbi:MAG TPA: preprotein translocase subunit YajC [Mycobacteriales bacterium]|nr:preprotein translocase subunit YajC [Mycobacteriales bacterium]
MHASLLNAVVAAVHAAGSTGGSTSSGGGGSSFAPFLFLLVIFLAGYLLFIRPARNRQRAAVDQRRKVSVGDEIITTSGLIATVVDVGEDALTLEIAPGVRARYVPAAILRVMSDEPEGDPAADVTNHEVIEPDEPGDGNDGSTAT